MVGLQNTEAKGPGFESGISHSGKTLRTSRFTVYTVKSRVREEKPPTDANFLFNCVFFVINKKKCVVFDVCPIPKGELLMREEPVLVLTRDSKMRGSEQLQDQFNRLHTDSKVSKMRGTEQLQDQFNRLSG